jgi:transcriptional regulator of acetoin/glycerol metabolism
VVDLVRAAREELIRVGLLTGVDGRGVVPELVMRSWRRSISSNVDSAAVCQRYQEIDADSVLCRAAGPVLERWQHQLAGTGTSLFLSDRSGSIVARRTSDSSVRRQLDSVHAAEGFDYAEDSVGTNGLGTSIIERRPVWIEGSQHYNEALGGLACAAAPVVSPTGSVIGSISLGGPVERASPLMLSLTREIGQQIEERLRADARPQDLAMAMSLMRFTNSQRPTVIMDGESMLANTPGVPYVSVSCQVLCWELLNAHDWSRQPVARFPLDETGVQVSARRIAHGAWTHFMLQFSGAADQHCLTAAAERVVPATVVSAGARVAPGRTGDSVLVVDGPPGSGRATAARDLHAQLGPGDELRVLVADPVADVRWAAVNQLLDDGTDVLVRRVDVLDDRAADRLRLLVSEHRSAASAGRRASVLLLTVNREQATPSLRELIDEMGVRGRTQALSATPERLPGLVLRVLKRVDPRRRHTLSPAALQAFMQWGWPGNIAELAATLEALVATVPAAVIERRHLPRHLQQAPLRRRLTLLEAAERDAIIRALTAVDGNKSEAAKLLGVGRTTLYRRLRQLGLGGGEDLL